MGTIGELAKESRLSRTTRVVTFVVYHVERLFSRRDPSDSLSLAEQAHLHRVSEKSREAIERGDKILRTSV